ncbi:MAG: hypothetical protein JJU11_05565 [Candidatus Sumerlaeia bacterium]|nr:hypothetical protein [Candidatus Sumerlaeia bacterium]
MKRMEPTMIDTISHNTGRHVWKSCILVGLVAMLPLLGGCGGQLFGVNLVFVGEQTALERQVLGTYEEIGRDLTTFSSVRAVDPDGNIIEPPAMTGSQAEVMRALNNRRYNRDDLDVLLTARVVREGNDGMLTLNPEPPEDWPLQEPIVRQIIEEENRDREVILNRLMQTTPGVAESDRGDVAWILATLNQQAAPTSSYVQERDGRWRVK